MLVLMVTLFHGIHGFPGKSQIRSYYRTGDILAHHHYGCAGLIVNIRHGSTMTRHTVIRQQQQTTKSDPKLIQPSSTKYLEHESAGLYNCSEVASLWAPIHSNQMANPETVAANWGYHLLLIQQRQLHIHTLQVPPHMFQWSCGGHHPAFSCPEADHITKVEIQLCYQRTQGHKLGIVRTMFEALIPSNYCKVFVHCNNNNWSQWDVDKNKIKYK